MVEMAMGAVIALFSVIIGAALVLVNKKDD